MFPTLSPAGSGEVRPRWAGWRVRATVWGWIGCLGAALVAQEPAVAPVLRSQPESNRAMAELLQRLSHEGDPMRNPFRSTDQIRILRERIEETSDGETLVSLKRALVRQLLQSGDPRAALKENERLLDSLAQRSPPLSDRDLDSLMTTSAICHLRIGEMENCLDQPNADSCLFPIRGGGVHQLQQGSRGAIRVLTELLQKFPGDLRARWLINIAYMTVGEYPDKVPPAWVIDPAVFASDYDIKRFPDVAPRVGLDGNDLAGGVVLDDFDNDGLLDLMVSSWGRNGQLRLYRNNGDGTFTDHTAAAGLSGEVGGLNLIQCDYNNDGYMDVLVPRGAWLHTEGHHPLSLLRNNGDFTFTDVTVEAGLLRFRPTQAVVCFDYDGDGWVDVFIANESDERDANPCELFHNNGDGTFTECAAETGLDFVGFFKGVVSADYNNDGRPDLFLSRRGGAKLLLRNDGPVGAGSFGRARWHFTDVTEEAGITDPEMSFSCWFWDYDNDGWPDLMVTGYEIQDVGDVAADYLGLPHSGERSRLYHNNHDGTFTDVSKATGVNKLLHTMGCNFGDLDNDGWLDFYVGTGDPDFATLIPNRMFRNDGGQRFQDVTASGGFGQLQKGHGIAFGDINNDGEQDVYSVVGGAVDADVARRQLFANPGHGNHGLKLKLEGRRSNRAAIGARIKVVVQTDGIERAIYRTVGSGGSFGASPLRQEIGLGRPSAISRVEITWPATGQVQVLTGLQMDQCYHVIEGDAAPVLTTLPRFAWPLSRTSGALATSGETAR